LLVSHNRSDTQSQFGPKLNSGRIRALPPFSAMEKPLPSGHG